MFNVYIRYVFVFKNHYYITLNDDKTYDDDDDDGQVLEFIYRDWLNRDTKTTTKPKMHA